MEETKPSVVFYCGENSTNGNVMLATNLLKFHVFQLFGSSTRQDVHALCDEGIYNVETGVEIVAPLNTLQFSTGQKFNVSLTSSGSLYSWGSGVYGELGQGVIKTSIPSPSKIESGIKYSSISSGYHHSIAIDNHGNGYSWGQNFDRQLGLYTKEAKQLSLRNGMLEEVSFVPRLLPLSLLKPILKVSCGSTFTVIVTKSGEVMSWGAGECGQLGTGRCTKREVPQIVSFLPMSRISSSQISPPVSPSSSSSSWVSTVQNGHTASTTTTTASSGVVARDVACGFGHVLVSTEDGSVYAWGLNKRGQLGVGDTNTRHTPVLVCKSSAVRVIAEEHSSAFLDIQGRLFTWGSTSFGRLMHPSNPPHVCESREDDPTSYDHSSSSPNDRSIHSLHPHQISSPSMISTISKHLLLPLQVQAFEGKIVHDFAFGKSSSAALVLSQIKSITPDLGPQLNFSKMEIQGSGFWNSESIIIKFISQAADASFLAPRSCMGRLTADGIVTCKPPRLRSPGDYHVTLSFDGKTFIDPPARLVVHKEFSIIGQSPPFIDMKQNAGISEILLTLKDFVPPEGFVSFKLTVKVLLSKYMLNESDPSRISIVNSEFLVPGYLVQEEGKEKDDFELTSYPSSPSIISRVNTAATELSKPPAPPVISDSLVRATIDLAANGITNDPACVFALLRTQISLNDQDFSSPSPETNSIICHKFSPHYCKNNSFLAEIPEDSPSYPERLVDVIGENLIPSSLYAQRGYSMEAVIRGSVFPGPMCFPDRVSRSGLVPFELIVPANCNSFSNLQFSLPAISEIRSTISAEHLESLPPSTPGPGAKQSKLGMPVPVEETVLVSVSFRLVNEHKIPFSLGDLSVVVFLYYPQPSIPRPFYCRSTGGKLTLMGGRQPDGFNFSASMAQLALRTNISPVGKPIELSDPIIVLKQLPFVPVPSTESAHMLINQHEIDSALSTAHESQRSILKSFSTPHCIEVRIPDLKDLFASSSSTTDSPRKTPDFLALDLLFDGESPTPHSYCPQISIYDHLELKTLTPPAPKGGFQTGISITANIEGLPSAPPTLDIESSPFPSTKVFPCLLKIRGLGEASTLLQAEIHRVESLSAVGGGTLTFIVPDSSVFDAIEPDLSKPKEKSYFLDLSLDDGVTFDEATTPLLSIKA